jgi:xylulokinase
VSVAGARSRLWNQIKADVLQRPVYLPQVGAGAPMGDAILAAVGAGIFPNMGAAVAAMVTRGAEFQPNPANAASYDALYRVYLSLYPALRDAFQQLAAAP